MGSRWWRRNGTNGWNCIFNWWRWRGLHHGLSCGDTRRKLGGHRWWWWPDFYLWWWRGTLRDSPKFYRASNGGWGRRLGLGWLLQQCGYGWRRRRRKQWNRINVLSKYLLLGRWGRYAVGRWSGRRIQRWMRIWRRGGRGHSISRWPGARRCPCGCRRIRRWRFRGRCIL